MRLARPRSLREALQSLADDPELRPVAGCTDLMVASPAHGSELPAVLDLSRLGELRGSAWRGDQLDVGALTTFSELAASPQVQQSFPSLAAAAALVGGWQIQNRATLGGNIANASPAGDSLPVLLALDAQLLLASAAGERALPYREFHLGYRRTALRSGELIARIRIPRPTPGSHQRFRKLGTREAQAISKLSVALLTHVEAGRIREYRIAAGSVAPLPLRLPAVERLVLGRAPDAATAELAAHAAMAAVEPIDDVRSSAAYRRTILGRVVRRLTLECADPAPAPGSPGARAS